MLNVICEQQTMAAELCSWFSGLIDNYLKLYCTVVYCCILFNKLDYIYIVSDILLDSLDDMMDT